MRDSIIAALPGDYPWRERLYCFPTLGSTNDSLKAMAKQGAPHGTAVLAGHQTSGHGRLGRSFHSPADSGIYLSILLRPGCLPDQLMHLTCAAAVAMCDAVERSCGFRPGIKWTNDLVYEKKKLGGILTELVFSVHGTVEYAIIGIGINCCQQQADFPAGIRDIAASLSMVTQTPTDRCRVAAAMLEALWHMDQRLIPDRSAIMDAYRSDCITVGQDICLIRGQQVLHGHALHVDEKGALAVRFTDGTVSTVNSGEVSVRGMYGYI